MKNFMKKEYNIDWFFAWVGVFLVFAMFYGLFWMMANQNRSKYRQCDSFAVGAMYVSDCVQCVKGGGIFQRNSSNKCVFPFK